MDGRVAEEPFGQIFFRVVDHLVNVADVGMVGDLGMQRYEDAVRAVIMHDHVVHAADPFKGQNGLFDRRNERRIGSSPEQRPRRIKNRFESGVQNKEGDQQPAPCVKVQPIGKADKMRQQRGEQNGGCGGGIGQAVERDGPQRGRGKPLGKRSVVKKHIELDPDGHGHDRDGGPEVFRISGLAAVNDDGKCAFQKRHAHQKDRRRNKHAGEVFKPAVSVRMIAVRLFCRDPEAKQRDGGGACVAEIVERIRFQRDGVHNEAEHQFDREQHDVQKDSEAGGKNAVCAANALRRIVRFSAYEQFCQQSDH